MIQASQAIPVSTPGMLSRVTLPYYFSGILASQNGTIRAALLLNALCYLKKHLIP
ncbi:hypothetical protein HCH52_08775 [Oscillospiraceae bacterium HV4-5-C5C]|nr:hypothetical protein [Oscillospiraceae bacterium HV4-5-C5C]